MAYTRLTFSGGHYYAILVESYREGAKVRQRRLENYGRVRRSFLRRLFKRKPSKAEIDRAIAARKERQS